MKYKEDDLANLVWISRFWAQYSKLLEIQKRGFYSLVLNTAKKIEKETTEQHVDKEKNSK